MAERRNWALLVGVLLVGCICVIEQAYIFSLTPDPCEDAYITFRFSQNLADGAGPVFNPGEHVEGYSNPLWMFSIAAARKLGFDMVGYSRMAGALFDLLTLLLVWYIPRRCFGIRGLGALFGPALYLLFLPPHFYAAAGLETSLYGFLVTASALAVIWAGNRAARCTAAFAVLLLTALTRPEGIIFCVFYGLLIGWRFLVRRESLKPYLPGAALFALCYGAFILWRLDYYGLPLPNTYYAKGSFPLYLRLIIGFFVNKGFFTSYAWLLVMLPCFLFVRIPDPRRALAPVVLFIAAGLIFSLGFSGFDWMPYYRYNLPIVPLMLVCVQALFSELWRTWAPTVSRKFVLAVLTACLFFTAGEQYWKDLSFNYRWRDLSRFGRFNQKALGEWMRRELGPKPVIAIGDVGYFAYISHATIIDLFGLTNREFARVKTASGAPDVSFNPPGITFNTLKRKEGELILELRPDYVFLYSARLKICDTYTGSAAGIADTTAFKDEYEYLSSFSIIPDSRSEAWPAPIHLVDVADLSNGLLSWMRTGWGYDIYRRRDSPHPGFHLEIGPDERIRKITMDPSR
jgi:arabinofuranosyltransferase